MALSATPARCTSMRSLPVSIMMLSVMIFISIALIACSGGGGGSSSSGGGSTDGGGGSTDGGGGSTDGGGGSTDGGGGGTSTVTIPSGLYEVGSPTLTDIWVDPASGSDTGTGADNAHALRTITEAWNSIPTSSGQLARQSTTGYRIMLAPGDYPSDSIPLWMSGRRGTLEHPIVIQAADGTGTARLHGYLNIDSTSYLYLVDITILTDPGTGGGGNVVHIANSDHVLIRNVTLSGMDGTERAPQETLKVNQTQYLYVENSDIYGAFWFALDFVAVAHGHVANNKLHDSSDDCVVLKGGTAQLLVTGNEVYNCGVSGITAGQGTGFEYMATPWIHYEAYDLKITNNLVHDAQNAGLAVRGGYNILAAYNTFYRTGLSEGGAPMLLVAQGYRSCDGNSQGCSTNRSLGGWGPPSASEGGQWIPNQNVYVYNNIFYNPAGAQTAYGHFSVPGPTTPDASTGIPSPSRADTNLRIRGNVIWDGPQGHPVGIEGEDQGCQPANSTCNLTALQADNAINTIEPQLSSNYRPVAGTSLYQATCFAIPAFSGTDRPTSPLPPQGELSNTVTTDRSGAARTGIAPPGAYLKTRL